MVLWTIIRSGIVGAALLVTLGHKPIPLAKSVGSRQDNPSSEVTTPYEKFIKKDARLRREEVIENPFRELEIHQQNEKMLKNATLKDSINLLPQYPLPAGLHVSHCAMENPYMPIGGVSSYLKGLAKATKKTGYRVSIFGPLYPAVLAQLEEKKLSFVGKLKHPIDNKMVTTTIYSYPHPDGYTLYYFVADPTYRKNIADPIKKTVQLYSAKIDTYVYQFIVLIHTYRLQLDILINTYRYQYEQEIR